VNLYFMVEGETTEKKVYRSWIEKAFPALRKAERLEDVWQNTYRLFSINGNTDRVDNINRALNEIAAHNAIAANEGRGSFDGLFICLDAEDATVELKTQQIQQLTASCPSPTQCYPIVHNCCIETWFLGNRPMMKRQNVERQQLREWKQFYDVSEACPEFMGKPSTYTRTKAWFHHDYLKEMLAERGISYSKKNPGVVQEREYLEALIERHQSNGHLQSFGTLLSFWRSLGGQV
jgi:hypothetical protein